MHHLHMGCGASKFRINCPSKLAGHVISSFSFMVATLSSQAIDNSAQVAEKFLSVEGTRVSLCWELYHNTDLIVYQLGQNSKYLIQQRRGLDLKSLLQSTTELATAYYMRTN